MASKSVYTQSSGLTTVTKFAADVSGQTWADLTSGGSLTTRYVLGESLDSKYARVDAGGVSWLLTDRLGSVRDVTNGSGAVVAHVDRDGYGNVTVSSGSGFGEYGFVGQRSFSEVFLIKGDSSARWYNPTTGNWMEEDPIRWGGGLMRLDQYVGNDPTNRTDPTGLDDEDERRQRARAAAEEKSRRWREAQQSTQESKQKQIDTERWRARRSLANRDGGTLLAFQPPEKVGRWVPLGGVGNSNPIIVENIPTGSQLPAKWITALGLKEGGSYVFEETEKFLKASDGSPAYMASPTPEGIWEAWKQTINFRLVPTQNSLIRAVLSHGGNVHGLCPDTDIFNPPESFVKVKLQIALVRDKNTNVIERIGWVNGYPLPGEGNYDTVMEGGKETRVYKLQKTGYTFFHTPDEMGLAYKAVTGRLILAGIAAEFAAIAVPQAVEGALGKAMQVPTTGGRQRTTKPTLREQLKQGRISLEVENQVCFVAGTPLLTPDGDRLIEEFKAGDLVLSRSDRNIEGPIEAKRVEEVFIRVGRVCDLRVGGKLIRATPEHPFWVRGFDWKTTQELKPGDLLCSHDGQWVPVDSVSGETGVVTVYNLRVEDHHTYFVGARSWGFSVWAHNAEYVIAKRPDGKWGIYYKDGNPVLDKGLKVQRPFEQAQDAQNWVRSGDPSAVVHPGGIISARSGAASNPGVVTKNKLSTQEYQFAQEIVKERGGHFIGQTVKNTPGIEGYIDHTPVSLKQTSGKSPSAVLHHASQAETEARNAKIKNVEVFIEARNISAGVISDFGVNGPLAKIPNQGTVSKIWVLSQDGWVTFP